jgi:hypothetical protein
MTTLAPHVRRSLLILVGVWVAWGACLLGFQELVVARLEPERPDDVLNWTAQETGVRRFAGRPYLAEPTLNTHVAFDSEYYLSIAVVGYDDPDVPQYQAPGGEEVPLNYAFLPAYPFTMRVVAAPLGWLGVEPIAAATVAGVAVSLLATLGAMLALYWLARRHLTEGSAMRAAFFLLIFPSGFFLAQVYTEALFLAVSFGALALIADRRPLLAGLLAIVAVLTRPVGIALVLPIGIGLTEAILRWRRSKESVPPWHELAAWGIAAVAPVLTYLAWSSSAMGRTFETVQREYFGRGLLNLEAAWEGWTRAIAGFADALPETRFYYGLEVAAVVLAVVACAWAFRRWPAASLFGLAVLFISLSSGEPQGMIRYALAVPAIFLLLARLGEQPIFDRGWTVLSLLSMGLLTTIYSFDFWVA